jgi:hypothetical protein
MRWECYVIAGPVLGYAAPPGNGSPWLPVIVLS